MSADAWFVLALLIVTVGLLVSQIVRTEVTALGIILALGFSGILTPEQALGGFSSPATLTVAAMLALSAALEKAGIVDYVSQSLAKTGGGGLRRLLAILMLPTALFSAFMNNTPVVALMVPVVLAIGKRFSIPGSKLLIPISYAAILGGTCTLIGTSTNILVDSVFRSAGKGGFSMFEFAPLGLLLLAVGLVYMLVLGPKLLPSRTALSELLSASAPGNYVTEIVIRAGSRWVGHTLGEMLGDAKEITVLEVVRDEEAIVGPRSDLQICPDDMLIIESGARAIHSLLSSTDVEHGTAVADDERVAIQRVDLRVAEMVVAPGSSFVGAMVRELGLSRKFGIQVLGIRRLGRHHTIKLREWELRSGDVLLVQGEPGPLRSLQDDGDVMLVEGVERELTFPRKAPVALGIFAAMVLAATLGLAPIVMLALAAVALMLVSRALEVREAVRAVEPAVLLLLAGTIPLGEAMQSTGLAEMVAGSAVAAVSALGPWALVAVVYLLSSLLTEVLSNNATAVILAPIALGVAQSAGVDPRPLMIAVAFGASACFASPIGYQTNTLVMGPGGYSFGDFVRVGLPLNLLLAAVATVTIPWLWPL